MHLQRLVKRATNEKETGLRAKMSGKQERARAVAAFPEDQSARKDSGGLPKKAL